MTAPVLRVLLASTHTYLPQRAGGIESNTHELCVELRRRGDAVAVLARISPEGLLGFSNRLRRKLPFGPLFPSDRAPGYPVYRGWKPEKGVTEVSRVFHPDVAVVQGTGCVPLARACLDAGLSTILYLHDVEFDRLGGTIPESARLFVFANSGFTARRAREELAVEAEVVPPVVRPTAYRTEGRGTEVLFINPHPWKGVETAFALAEARPDISFRFVETWDLGVVRRQAYRSRAAALPNVEWSETVADMRSLYGRARLLIVPSVWEETWGRVATEAQVSGIPVLASDRGGLPESVGTGGVLIDPDASSEEWTEALGRIWDDAAEYDRLSTAAREHARRPEIQPAAIVSRLRGLLTAHVRTVAHARATGSAETAGN